MYITQLIYINEGREKVFDEFEHLAIPLIAQHGGRLLLRIRPGKEACLENSIDLPYEIHLIEFDHEEGFAGFMEDEERKKFLHLKNTSVKAVLLIKGEKPE